MELEFIKNKVYYRIFDKTYTDSTHMYSLHKCDNDAKLAEIKKNISNAKNALDAKELLILKQVHGNNVIDAMFSHVDHQPEADGAVTDQKFLGLSALTADCVPVLFASSDGMVIGAAHCGWKGAKLDIIHKVSNLMKSKGAKEIKAIIGPAIRQKSYEVDSNYYDSFINENMQYQSLFLPSDKAKHFMFDLVGFVKMKLAQEAIECIYDVAEDTYSIPEKYPSYRRSCHQGKQYSRNILSTIIIK